MSADDHTTPNGEQDQNSLEMDAVSPPRIVSETPLGGVPKPAAAPSQPEPGGTPASAGTDEFDTLRDIGVSDNFVDHLETVGPDDVSDSVNIPPRDNPPVEDADPDRETVPSDNVSAELAHHMRRAMTHDEDSQELPKVTLDSPSEGNAESVTDDTTESAAAPTSRIIAQEPVQPGGVRDADDWDDDISPELASVLFAAKPSSSTPSAAPVSASPAGEAPSARSESAEIKPAQPGPVAAPPAQPIQLTSKAEAHTLAITAEGHAAPAPAAPLNAKVRYVRVEEPLKEDNGQRIEESWSYFKGEYPALAGRLVREVTIEEIRYTDGSWKWTYERRYDDRGRDSREVRANADESYFERVDTASAIDPEGKRTQYEEQAELIHAAPEADEKRGGILGGLFGRDKDAHDAAAAAVWRAATAAEIKQARRDGGDAFDRSLFERLF